MSDLASNGPNAVRNRPETNSPQVRVIDSLWTFFVALAVVGPFALPLLWRNPRFQLKTKVIGSIAIIVFTVLLVWKTGNIFQNTLEKYRELKAMKAAENGAQTEIDMGSCLGTETGTGTGTATGRDAGTGSAP